MANTVSSVGQSTGINDLIKQGSTDIFGTQGSTSYPLSGLFDTANTLGSNLPTDISSYGSSMQSSMGDLSSYLNQYLSESMPGSSQYNDLWNQLSSRYINSMTPSLEGAGILSSGTGLNTLSQGLQDLGTQFSSYEQQQLGSALSTGLNYDTLLNTVSQAPITDYLSLLSAIEGQPQTSTSSSQGLYQLLGGSTGLSNLYSLGSTIGGSGNSSSGAAGVNTAGLSSAGASALGIA